MVVALAYFFLGHVSLLAVSSHGIVTPTIFLPEGAALAAGILIGPRIASGVFLGQLLLALSRGQSWEPALAIAVVNSFEVVIGALLARRWGIGTNLAPGAYLRLLLLIYLILQPFSATLGTAALWYWDVVTTLGEFRQVWLSWWSGNALAQTLLVPLLLAARNDPRSRIRQAATKSALPLALLALLVGFSFYSPVSDHHTVALLGLGAPLLLWIAGRAGIAMASLTTTVLVMALLYLTGQADGPFVREGAVLVFDLNAFSLGLVLTVQVFSLLNVEHKRMEAERTLLLDQLRISASVFSSTQDGVLITDSQRRIIDVNAAFTQISGYQHEEVLGRDPKCLASGMTPPEIYADMWQSLIKAGFWRGELINRHKKGHVVAETIAISAVRTDDGSISHYVAVISCVNPLRNDHLTGLPSRIQIYDRLAKTLAKAHAHHHKVALIILCLDRLRTVNLAYGQAAGDRVLRVTGQRLTGCLPETASLGRMHGDEYAIILDELTHTADVEGIVKCLLAAANQPLFLKEEKFQVTSSLGIAFYPDDAQELKDLLRCGDLALQVAKDQGGASSHYYRAGLQQQALERKWLMGALRSALEKGHFCLHYQPIVHLATGVTHKAEALIRWYHPEKGPISPADFIPMAEKMGLIGAISDWILQEALKHAAMLRRQRPDFQISFNVSPVHLQDKQFDEGRYLGQLAQMGLPGSALVLEITEGLLLEANQQVLNRLSACRAAGIQVALDDFGTGYSSLSYLNRFEIDYLKIDRSFVHNLQSGAKEYALCETMVTMAHKLGLSVIAEGIETQEQSRLLKDLGCDFGQGYLFAEPLSIAELLALMHKS